MNNEEDFLCLFYQALADEDEETLRNLPFPHSDVFHARGAVYIATGIWLSLEEMEEYLKEEGLL